MLFNSNEFLVFFALSVAAYSLIGRYGIRVGNGLVVLASYLFYSAWDYRFTGRLFFTSTLDFTVARLMQEPGEARRRWRVSAGIVLNLGRGSRLLPQFAGTRSITGFDLGLNFNLPHFATSLRHFLWILAAPLVGMQLWQWRKSSLHAPLELTRRPRAALQGMLLVLLVVCWKPEASPFVYFQF